MTCACQAGGECDLVSAETMTCRLHSVEWCQVCVIEELHHEMARWLAELAERKQESIHERFDVGGES